MIRTGILQSIIILFFLGTTFSQEVHQGIIKNASTSSPIPYASIRIKNTKTQSVANADGRFSLPYDVFSLQDTIIISCVGYSPKAVAIKDIGHSFVVCLVPRTYQLNDINVTTKGNVDYPYQLFSELCQKYRKFSEILPAKGYFSFLSQFDEVPLEIVEGYFNSDISCNSGITKLKLKNGRIGFCVNSFYSLNTTDIFTHFNLFSLSGNLNIPSSPGNFNYRQLKKSYEVKIIGTSKEDGDKILVLQFRARKDTTNLFSGYAWINKNRRTIEKLEYTLSDNDFYYFKPLISGDRIDSIQVSIVFTFDNSKEEQPVISRSSLNYSLLYTSLKSSNTMKIKSEATLLFYDYFHPFPGIIPEKLIEDQDNDYQKVASLPYDSIFWGHPGITPQSDKQKEFVDYFHTNGVLINFSKALDSLSNSNYIRWSGTSDLSHSDLLNKPPSAYVSHNGTTYINSQNPAYYDIDCQILINPVEIGDSIHVTSVSLFNKITSFYFLGRGSKASFFINLYFDLYERERREMMTNYYQVAGTHKVTNDELRDIYNSSLHQLKDTLKIFREETQDGISEKDLIRWYKIIDTGAGIDRSSLMQNMLTEEAEMVKHKKTPPGKK